ncbi:MAG: hypothetical protein Q9164_007854 [Protoblastenia rupestris]
MVEDEFLSTAQTYTNALHLSEYRRLRQIHHSPTNLTRVNRSTDQKTVMRTELRRQKDAQRVSAKAKAGVEDILSRAKANRQKNGAESGRETRESEVEMEQTDKPWQGTQLQYFMTQSPRKGYVSLVGVQGVGSRTRAAAGFGRAERGTPSNSLRTTTFSAKVGDEEEDEDTDDLDAPVLRASSRPAPSHTTKGKRTIAPSPTHLPNPQVPKQISTNPSSPQPPKRRPPPPPPQRAFLDMSPINSKPAPIPTAALSTSKPFPPPLSPPPLLAPTKPKPHSHPSCSSSSRRATDFRPDHQIHPSHPPKPGSPLSSTAAAAAAKIRSKIQARREKEIDREKAGKSGNGNGRRGDEIPVFLV